MTNLVDKTCKKTGWRTPPKILDPLHEYARKATGEKIYLDPATSEDNPVGARMFATERHDGLSIDWKDKSHCGKLVFVNPPYGKVLKQWLAKIGAEALAGTHLAALLPVSRTEQLYFQDSLFRFHAAVCFVRSRLRFLDDTGKPHGGNPYASMLYLFNGDYKIFAEQFEPVGAVLKLTPLVERTH